MLSLDNDAVATRYGPLLHGRSVKLIMNPAIAEDTGFIAFDTLSMILSVISLNFFGSGDLKFSSYPLSTENIPNVKPNRTITYFIAGIYEKTLINPRPRSM